jgi:hypothetical protein
MNAGHLVDRRNRTANETAILIAGHRHDAAEGLQDDIIARRILQRSGAAEPRNAAMDQPIVQRPKRRRIDPQPFGYAGPEAFDRNIGGFRQRMNDSASLFGFQIDRDTALVAVGAEKYRSETGGGKRRPAPGFVALPHRLHLDDLGAKIAEILRA